jgi:hypothetical protein
MKIILSRKGFDSEFGKITSPILPDKTMLSLPIPQVNDTIKFDEIYYQNKSYLEIIKELNPKWKYLDDQTAHLDPDLREDILKNRAKNWKPIFGQSAAAQGHLNKQGVGIGDIFLFFGSFEHTEKSNEGKLKYKSKNKDYPSGFHIVFGYLQIGEIYKVSSEEDYENLPEFIKYHSHANRNYVDKNNRPRKNNCIYVASKNLSINPKLPGAGALNFREDRILTKKMKSKSIWQLPAFFEKLKISYHDTHSFNMGSFQSAPKGQEFVIEANNELLDWVINKIK